MEEGLVVVFVFTEGARGCLELMEKGKRKCRSARVPFGQRATEAQKGSIVCPREYRWGHAKRRRANTRMSFRSSGARVGKVKRVPPPVHQKNDPPMVCGFCRKSPPHKPADCYRWTSGGSL